MKQLVRTAQPWLAALCVVLLLAGVAQGKAYSGSEEPRPKIIPGLVTVVFEDDVELGALARGFGTVRFGIPSLDKLLDELEVSQARYLFPWHKERPARNSGRLDPTRFYELAFPESIPVDKVIESLAQNPNVKLAEPVWALPLRGVHLNPDDTLPNPNDPSWTAQWAMSPPPYDPYYYNAWDLETGSDSVKFACIDSGVNYKHPDLMKHIWVNPGEDVDGDGAVMDLDDIDGLDNDSNGIVDDLIGYDFFTGFGIGVWPGEDGGTVDSDPSDFAGHGTHVAGIAAAMTNNNLGVTGVAGGWHGGNRALRGAQIMCIRVGGLANDGIGYVNANNCGTGISYAALNGADVINCSWGSQGVGPMQVGMQDAADSGVTVVHAAGNDNLDDPDYLDFDPKTTVLSVAGTGPSDVRWSSSNYGYWVDVSAPASNILSTSSEFGNPGYLNYWGTSFAAPMVSGLALLIRSAMPSLTKDQVDSLIVLTADAIDSLHIPEYWGKLGSGRINAYSALVDLANAKFTADVTEGPVPLNVQFTDMSPDAPNSPSAWWWSFGTGDSSNLQNPPYTYVDPGVYSVSLIVDQGNPLGYGEEHLKNYIWARADTLRLDSMERQLGEVQVVMPVYLANTAQVSDIQFAFQFTNANNVKLDSVSTAGLRTEYFHSISYTFSDPANQRYVLLMESSDDDYSEYLAPGGGPVLSLHFSTPFNAVPGIVTIDTATLSSKEPKITTIWGDYWPDAHQAGSIVIPFCDHGDANCDGDVNVVDITQLVQYLFYLAAPIDPRGGDADASGGVNVADITYLVQYLFFHGPPPPP